MSLANLNGDCKQKWKLQGHVLYITSIFHFLERVTLLKGSRSWSIGSLLFPAGKQIWTSICNSLPYYCCKMKCKKEGIPQKKNPVGCICFMKSWSELDRRESLQIAGKMFMYWKSWDRSQEICCLFLLPGIVKLGKWLHLYVPLLLMCKMEITSSFVCLVCFVSKLTGEEALTFSEEKLLRGPNLIQVLCIFLVVKQIIKFLQCYILCFIADCVILL